MSTQRRRRPQRRARRWHQSVAAAAVTVTVAASAALPAAAEGYDPPYDPDAPVYASSVGWMLSRDFVSELDAMAGQLGAPIELPDRWQVDEDGQLIGGGDDDACGSAPGDADVPEDEAVAIDAARREDLVAQFTDRGHESPNMVSALLAYADWTLGIDYDAPATDTWVERLVAFEGAHPTFAWHAGMLAGLTSPEGDPDGLEDASPDSIASMWPEGSLDDVDANGDTKDQWLDALAGIMDDIAGERGANAEYWEREAERYHDLGDAEGEAHAREHAAHERAAQQAAEAKAKRYRELAEEERQRQAEDDGEEEPTEEEAGSTGDGEHSADMFGPVTIDDVEFLVEWAPWLAGTRWDADGGKIALIFLLDDDPGADPTVGNPNPAAEPTPVVEHQPLDGGPPPDLVNYLDVTVTHSGECLEAKLAVLMWDDPEGQVPVVLEDPDGDQPVEGGDPPTPPVATP